MKLKTSSKSTRMVIKNTLIFSIIILIGNIAIAQTDFSHYLDSLNRIDSIEQVYFPKEIKNETPQMIVEIKDTPKIVEKFNYHIFLMQFHNQQKRITGDYSKFYKKAPPSKK